MNPLEYLHLQLRLEGMEVIHGDRLRQVEIVPDEEVPLMVIAKLNDGHIAAYYDESLPADLHDEMAGKMNDVEFPTIGPLLDVLKERTLSFDTGYYKTYGFPEVYRTIPGDLVEFRSADDPQVQAFGFGGFPGQVYCIRQDEKIVSACVSTRENEWCGEVWMYTHDEYRKQGFARQVVSAWAWNMLQAGKVPFYSHKISNIASANLACRLGLQPLFEEISISYMNV